VSIARRRATFRGAEGNALAAGLLGAGERVAFLLHGGGQTRHAWESTALRLARAGFVAIAVDQRGQGESEWVRTGHCSFAGFAEISAVFTDSMGHEALRLEKNAWIGSLVTGQRLAARRGPGKIALLQQPLRRDEFRDTLWYVLPSAQIVLGIDDH
jgi:pimeloyl-ACP methyl ester carboxylesterase